MVNIYDVTGNRRNPGIPDDIQDLVNSIVSGIMALAARAANSNSDSNSLGGILIQSLEKLQACMPETKPRTKASKDEQLVEP